jgi:hypothetical protein
MKSLDIRIKRARAETLAVEAMRRSWDRRETAGPLASFFQQTLAPGTHLGGGGIQP